MAHDYISFMESSFFWNGFVDNGNLSNNNFLKIIKNRDYIFFKIIAMTRFLYSIISLLKESIASSFSWREIMI